MPTHSKKQWSFAAQSSSRPSYKQGERQSYVWTLLHLKWNCSDDHFYTPTIYCLPLNNVSFEAWSILFQSTGMTCIGLTFSIKTDSIITNYFKISTLLSNIFHIEWQGGFNVPFPDFFSISTEISPKEPIGLPCFNFFLFLDDPFRQGQNKTGRSYRILILVHRVIVQTTSCAT